MRHGFTLIELMIVIAIVALIAGFAVPGIIKLQQGAHKSDDATRMKDIRLAIERYAGENAIFGDLREVDGGKESDFRFLPAKHLYVYRVYGRPEDTDVKPLPPYFDLPMNLALEDLTPYPEDREVGPDFATPGILSQATHISNPWELPYQFSVFSRPIDSTDEDPTSGSSKRMITSHVVMRSQGREEQDPTDDVFWMLNVLEEKWTQVYPDLSELNGQDPAPSPGKGFPLKVDSTKYQAFYWEDTQTVDDDPIWLLTKPYSEVVELLAE